MSGWTNISLKGTVLDANEIEIGTPVLGESRVVSCEHAILKQGPLRNSPKSLDVLDECVSDSSSGSQLGPGYEDVDVHSTFQGDTPHVERNPVIGESKVVSCVHAILKHGQARNSPLALDVLDECAEVSGDATQLRSFGKLQQGPGYEDVDLHSTFQGDTPQIERNPVLGESKVVDCTHDILKHGRQENNFQSLDNLDVWAEAGKLAKGASE